MNPNWLRDLAPNSLGDFEATEELDRELSLFALRSQTDDNKAFELLGLLAWKIERFVRRFRYWDLHPHGLDDVVQETYLAFLDTLRCWTPTLVDGRPAGYLFYFLKVFPLRLATAVRRWRRPPRAPVVHLVQPRTLADANDSKKVNDFCSNLSRDDATLVQLHIVRGLSVPRAAQAMGIARSTAHRRWRRIVEHGREYLKEAG